MHAREHRLEGREALAQVEGLINSLAPLKERLGAILFQMGPGFRFPRDASALGATLGGGFTMMVTVAELESTCPSEAV